MKPGLEAELSAYEPQASARVPGHGGAKTNSHVHSPHKTRELSMGTDGHTGPRAFISVICLTLLYISVYR